VLELRALGAGYGKVPVLFDVSLRVERGEAVALLGSNNAGKTTLLRAISGLVRTTSGAILLDGADITGFAYERIVRLGVAQIPEGRHVFPEMSVEENLLVGATRLAGGDRRRRLREIFEQFPLLEHLRRRAAGSLSGGQQQTMVIARALMSRPALLLADEPSVGLSPVAIDALFDVFAALRRDGTTIVLAEQNAAFSLDLCDRGYVLQRGRITLADDVAQLRSAAGALHEAYLA
jgi:branched-chain amino acid transport system ATP-binding protein